MASEERTRLLTTQHEWCRKPTTESGWALRPHINHIKRAKGLSVDVFSCKKLAVTLPTATSKIIQLLLCVHNTGDTEESV